MFPALAGDSWLDASRLLDGCAADGGSPAAKLFYLSNRHAVRARSRAGAQEANGPWVKQSHKKSIPEFGSCVSVFLLGVPKQATKLHASVSLCSVVLQGFSFCGPCPVLGML